MSKHIKPSRRHMLLVLLDTFGDIWSKLMIVNEYLHGDPILETRYYVEEMRHRRSQS